ncbi:MAG TPA: GNAT family protein, partial [Burkholderiales bacterium]|nr:GNAT family protein [Burkholderiales bacterium]
LNVIQTWVAEGNPSQRLVERLGFRFVGRQRSSHAVDGRPCDRLLYDLLASEHREIEEDRWERVDERRIRPEAQGRAAGRTGHSNAAA